MTVEIRPVIFKDFSTNVLYPSNLGSYPESLDDCECQASLGDTVPVREFEMNSLKSIVSHVAIDRGQGELISIVLMQRPDWLLRQTLFAPVTSVLVPSVAELENTCDLWSFQEVVEDRSVPVPVL